MVDCQKRDLVTVAQDVVLQPQVAVGLDDIAGVAEPAEGLPGGHDLSNLVDHLRVAQGRDVTQRFVEQNRAQRSSHVLAGTRLGKGGHHQEIRGYGGNALLAAHEPPEAVQVLVLQPRAGCGDDKGHRRLALFVVGRAHHHRVAQRRLGAQHLVAQNRSLDFFGADAVAGDVDDIVGAPVQGERTVVVVARVVALGIGKGSVPAVEIHRAEALEVTAPVLAAEVPGIAPDGARQVRVGPGDDQFALFAAIGAAPAVGAAGCVGILGDAHFGLDPGQRPGLGVGRKRLFAGPWAGEHDAAVLGRPVGIDVVATHLLHGELLHGR